MPRKPKSQPSFHFNFRVVINHNEQTAQIHLVEYQGTRIIGFDPEPFSPLGSDLYWHKKTSPARAIKELKQEMTNMRQALNAPPLDYKKLVKINERSDAKPLPTIVLTPEDAAAIQTNIYLKKD